MLYQINHNCNSNTLKYNRKNIFFAITAVHARIVNAAFSPIVSTRSQRLMMPIAF